MRSWIFKLAARIARWAYPEAHIIMVDPTLLMAARGVVMQVADDIENASPENKHARAFTLLSRRRPGDSRRDVGLAIELALR